MNKGAVLAMAIFAALLLLQWFVNRSEPRCFTDEQCADLREIEMER